MSSMSWLRRFALAAALALFTGGAMAQGGAAAPNASADFDLRLGVGYSDNIRRSAVDPLSSRYDYLGFRSNYFRDGSRLDINLLSDLLYRSYSEGDIPSEPIGSISAGLAYDIVPDSFSWTLNDFYGQGTTNQFAPSSPDNRQEINIISTGPRLQLPLGQRGSFIGSATKGKNDFSGLQTLDFERTDYSLQFDRLLSQTSTLGIGALSRDIEFEDSSNNSGSERLSLFLSYGRDLATGGISLRGGRTRVEFGGLEQNTPFVDVSWTRNIGARSRFTLGATRDFIDLSGLFVRNTILAGDVPGGNIVLVNNLIEFTRLRSTFTIAYPRTTWSIGGTLGELRYENASGLDNDEVTLNLGVTRTIRPRLNLSLTYQIYQREYVEQDIRNRDEFFRLQIRQGFGRRFFLTVSAVSASRDGGAATFPFDENVIDLSVGVDLNP